MNIPRTNCNVMGMLPRSWTSRQQSDSNPEDWYGIAGPVTAKPYRSAHAYSRAAKLMRGQLSQAPPSKPLVVCPGMPPPKPPDEGRPDPCTIAGTSGADHLAGTRRADVICALAGRDTVAGRRGRDRLKGGGGRDRLRGGPGRDLLDGGSGRDVCHGRRGRDRFRSCERISAE